MAGSSPWVVYSGAARIILVLALAVVTAVVLYGSVRLPLPARLPTPGRRGWIIMVAAWVAAIVALLVCVAVYEVRSLQAGSTPARRSDPITPVTLVGVMVVFLVIAVVHRKKGWRVALGGALIGALAAPWLFEVPFDLIILPRTHPVIDPGLFRLLLFVPLILTGVTTVILLSLVPVVRVRRVTLWCWAATLAVFAIWGALGFGYPSASAPITLNILSKILGLLTGLTLFLPDGAAPDRSDRLPNIGPRSRPVAGGSQLIG